MLAQYSRKKSIAHALILVAVFAAAGGGISLWSNPLCACASPAWTVLGRDWVDLDTTGLNERAKRRFPAGMSAAELREHITPLYYSKHCTEQDSGRTVLCKHCTEQDSGPRVLCTLPFDRNAWRERHARLEFAFDREARLRDVAAMPVTR